MCCAFTLDTPRDAKTVPPRKPLFRIQGAWEREITYVTCSRSLLPGPLRRCDKHVRRAQFVLRIDSEIEEINAIWPPTAPRCAYFRQPQTEKVSRMTSNVSATSSLSCAARTPPCTSITCTCRSLALPKFARYFTRHRPRATVTSASTLIIPLTLTLTLPGGIFQFLAYIAHKFFHVLTHTHSSGQQQSTTK